MEGDAPDPDIVLRTFDAAGTGITGREICDHLKTLWDKRYRPGTPKGPRTFGWFPVVVKQHFDELRAMAAARNDPGLPNCTARADADFDAQLEAF